MIVKEIPGQPGYFAGDDGHIYSRKRSKEIRLTETLQRHGYLTVGTFTNRKHKTYYVHRLMALTFLGYPTKDQQVSHLDGCPTNNIPSNLCWESPKENTRRKYKHGTMGKRRKLTPADIETIHEMLDAGSRQINIAEAVHVHQGTVSRIKLERLSDN